MQRSSDAGRLERADNEAADNINQGYQWKDVHETWEKSTGVTMSPATFGRRILDFRANRDNRSSTSISEPSPTLPAPAARQMSINPPLSTGTTYPTSTSVLPPLAAPPLPIHHHRPLSDPDTSNAQTRMEQAINRLQVEMQQVWTAIGGMREELRKRSSMTSSERTVEDPAAFEMLSETVTNASNKAGEIDGLKLQLDMIKRRLKRLEDPKAPPTPSPLSQYAEGAFSARQAEALAQSQQSEHGSTWNTAHPPAKRKSASFEVEDTQEATKRLRATIGHAPAQTISHIRGQSLEDSQSSWRPESQRQLPPLPNQFPERRLPGRPRKSPPPDLGTPAWEHESWSGAEIGPDGYYRPALPGTERGRLIRRGAGGGDVFDHSAKRTRQKPVRNSEGVLIRKDGKPDQRSISSPMNLKKVHARKIAEPGESGSDSPVATSPTERAPTGGSGGSGSEERAMYPSTQDEQQRSTLEHGRIMHKMFPQGVNSDTQRLDHAGRLFPHETLQRREERIKSDMQKTSAQQTTEVDQASGSLFVPDTENSQEDAP